MKARHLFLYLPLVAALSLTACGGDDDDFGGGTTPGTTTDGGTSPNNVNANKATTSDYATRLEFPHLQDGNLLITHSTSAYGVNYSLEWNPALKSQRWTCYQMYAANSVKNTERWYAAKGEVQYPQDPDLPVEYRFATDPFYNTGYDHGHICPSADRLCSLEANKQTFYLTNMMPQVNGFNAKVWANMESMLRSWNTASFRDTLYVCKGGTIEATTACPDAVIKTLGSGLIVPKYYFMAILCKNSEGYRAIGFWIEHKACNDGANSKYSELAKYAVNIDELERLTGIDFFCNLPDDVENHIEALPVDNVKRLWGFSN